MRRDFLLVLLLLLPASWALSASDLGITDQNIARIVDFNNDGTLDILGFSDRIDTRNTNISLYYGPDFDQRLNLLEGPYERCALDYGDANNDSYLEIIGHCFDESNALTPISITYNGTGWENTSWWGPLNNQSTGTSSYGDVIQLDFTGDGYEDVISCIYTNTDDLALFAFNSTDNNFNSYESGIPSSRVQNTNNAMENCYLTPLDFDADDDFDLIVYQYDDSNFTLYNNTGGYFTLITDQSYFNLSYFQTRLIKHIQSYDSGDGYPDLYFIIDENNSVSPRNITFGYFPNQHRTFSDLSPSAPNQYITYFFDNSSYVNASWQIINNSNELRIELNGSEYYNINISPLFAADFPQTNYDHKAKYGNLQSRSSLNLSVAHQCFNVSTQAISKNLLVSSFSSYSATPLNFLDNTLELCDGYDNDCDGVVDNAFTFVWPDGANSTFDFDNDSDGYYPRNHTFTYDNGTQDFNISFSCEPRKNTFNSSTTDANYFDPDDNNEDVYCSGSTGCAPTVENQADTSSGGSTSSGGGGSIGGIFNTVDDTNTEDSGDADSGDQETDVEPEIEEDITPQVQVPKSSSANQKIQENFDLIKNQPYRVDRKIESIGGRTRITETVTNRYIYTLEDMTATVIIPKEIEERASNIIATTPFRIIEEDPIIAFDVGTLGTDPPHNEFSYTYTIDDIKDVTSIQTTIDYAELSEEEINIIEREDRQKQEETSEYVNTTLTYVVEDNTTTFNIDFEFDDDTVVLNNYTIFYHIPDCLLQIIEEEAVKTNREFTIIKKDPMIAWHFEQLTNTDEIQLQINAIAESDCIEQARIVRSVAQEIIDVSRVVELDVNVWPPVIVSLILFIVLYVLSGFTKEKYHHDHETTLVIKQAKRLIKSKHTLGDTKKKLEQHHPKDKVKEAIESLQHPVRQFFIKFAIGLEFLILMLLIAINILDFFKVLPENVDFFKKIISWILLIILIRHVGISYTLFGKHHKWIDAALIFSFFMLTLKNLINFIDKTIHRDLWAFDLFSYIKFYNVEFQAITFSVGICGLLLVGLYIAYTEHFRKDSFYGALFLHGKNKHGHIRKYFQTLAVLILFFVLVFNLMFEWLAIAVDAPILVTVLIIMLISIIATKIKKHISLSPQELIEDIAEKPDHFYEHIIELFHHPKFVPLAISGMFVLHLVTEIGVYLIPYVLGVIDPVYISLDDNHIPLFSIFGHENLFALSAQGLPLAEQLLFASGYAINIIAMLCILILPLWLWLYSYRHKHKPLQEYSIFHVFKQHDNKLMYIFGELLLVFFVASLLFFILKPAFLLVPFQQGLLLGVDILTQRITLFSIITFLVAWILIVATATFALRKHKLLVTCATLPLSLITLFIYDILYLYSMISYSQATFQQLGTWMTVFGVLENITILATLVIVAISMGTIYIVSVSFLAFLYLPTRWKKAIYKKAFPKHIAEAQEHHHIHFHHLHDHHIHGHKVEHVKKHIIKQLNAGHDVIVVVERLHHHHWPYDVIEQALVELDDTKAYAAALKHVKHKQHKKKVIEKLVVWLQMEYNKGRDLETLSELALKKKWYEEDVHEALKHLVLRKEDKALKRFFG